MPVVHHLETSSHRNWKPKMVLTHHGILERAIRFVCGYLASFNSYIPSIALGAPSTLSTMPTIVSALAD